ncbi:unnamed protein product, partial [Polarella glacialis]
PCGCWVICEMPLPAPRAAVRALGCRPSFLGWRSLNGELLATPQATARGLGARTPATSRTSIRGCTTQRSSTLSARTRQFDALNNLAERGDVAGAEAIFAELVRDTPLNKQTVLFNTVLK